MNYACFVATCDLSFELTMSPFPSAWRVHTLLLIDKIKH